MASGRAQEQPPAGQGKFWPLQGWTFYLTIAVLGVIGLALASYLTYLDYSNSQGAACPIGSGCDEVRQSEYVNLLGIPVGLWGVIGYVTITGIALLPLQKRWKSLSLFTLTAMGFTFSCYLTYLELFVIHAICPYCVGSAVVMIILFLMMVSRKPIVPQFPASRLALFAGGLVGIVILGSVFLPKDLTASKSNNVAPEEFQVKLAEHLTSIGAVIYSQPLCGACQMQKEMFGDAVDLLNIVECTEPANRRLCTDKEIQSTPTWEISGVFYTGVMSLENLAKLSRYEGPIPKEASSP